MWNQFGGRMSWDESAIVGDDPNFGGTGNKSTGDLFHAAPNIDHTQPFVRRDICDWLNWLRDTAGFDGWRLDFVRGFTGEAVGEYMECSQPSFAVGEYWCAAFAWGRRLAGGCTAPPHLRPILRNAPLPVTQNQARRLPKSTTTLSTPPHTPATSQPLTAAQGHARVRLARRARARPGPAPAAHHKLDQRRGGARDRV